MQKDTNRMESDAYTKVARETPLEDTDHIENGNPQNHATTARNSRELQRKDTKRTIDSIKRNAANEALHVAKATKQEDNTCFF